MSIKQWVYQWFGKEKEDATISYQRHSDARIDMLSCRIELLEKKYDLISRVDKIKHGPRGPYKKRERSMTDTTSKK
jgi:hypothetical protein